MLSLNRRSLLRAVTALPSRFDCGLTTSVFPDALVRTDVGIAITLIQLDPIVDSRTIAPGTS